ncbi:hypothetical protein KUTeg_000149 [Tegillarca granosa]|uniref:Galactose mutarotase n=1 Tax=Tegillarca granosa TaxID=220873 RepID=A0ABQ9FWQ3_TEGGR|nr:hypothetical protein KUTeg_000149 [Tegillarca granosa]
MTRSALVFPGTGSSSTQLAVDTSTILFNSPATTNQSSSIITCFPEATFTILKIIYTIRDVKILINTYYYYPGARHILGSFNYIRWTIIDYSDQKKLIARYTLTNKNKVTVRIINLGCIPNIFSTGTSTMEHKHVHSCSDFKTKRYEDQSLHFGGIIGRYATRINNGKFKFDGKKYNLTLNRKPNHIHGGFKGFTFLSSACLRLQTLFLDTLVRTRTMIYVTKKCDNVV